MKYKTGDVEKILGISVETLRFFESIGLVKPERNEKNNYRYYEAVELNKMVAYKFFRGFEFSLEESIELVEGSNKLCQQKIQTQSKIIEDRIQYYQCLAWRLKELETSYQRINDLTGSIEKAKSPEILLYYNQYESEFAKDEIHIKTT
ncbi:MAG TPA: MerR family transcriptional regulator, partial [Eubacteriaceae bacterium]|nr:MerR family transcriptional regulator [Eubacteriaceae bacterium]